MFGISVTCFSQEIEVALLGACRESRGGPDPVYIPNDSGNLCEICQADEFRHQGDTGSGGAGHASPPGPACSKNHACSCKLVLSLDHGAGSLSIARIS